MYTTVITSTDTSGLVNHRTLPPVRDIRDARQEFDEEVGYLRTNLTDCHSPILAGRLTSYSIVSFEDDDVVGMENGFFRAELDMWCIVTMGASHEGDLDPTLRIGAYGDHFDDVPAQ